MEAIQYTDGNYYYGIRRCIDVDEAYSLFRRDYHESLGAAVHNRLDRLGRRRERVHGYGFVFTGDLPYHFSYDGKRVPCYIMGIVGLSYCRMVDMGYSPEGLDEDDMYRWIDFIYRRGCGILKMLNPRKRAVRRKRRAKS